MYPGLSEDPTETLQLQVDSDTNKTYKFDQIENASRQFARTLLSMGVKPGETICIISGNCTDFVLAVLAITCIRGCVTSVSNLATTDEVQYQVLDSGAVYLMTDRYCLEKAAQVKKLVPNRIKAIFILEEVAENSTLSPQERFLDDALESTMANIDAENTLLLLPYSSGTTGLPKGVIHTHQSVVGGICSHRQYPYRGIDQGGTTLCLLPMHYLMAFDMVFMSITLGAKVVFMRSFHYEKFIDIVQKYQVTFVPAVPAMVEILLQKQASSKYGNITSVRSMLSSGDTLRSSRGHLLKSVYNIERLINGDRAYYDEEGHIHLLGRLKNVIKYKGHQVSPEQLESILQNHEAVSDVVVVGIPDTICGELPRAFVVLKSGYARKVTNEEIAKYVAARSAPFRHLHGGVEFVEELPKSAVGKVLRQKVLDDYIKRMKSTNHVTSVISRCKNSSISRL